MSTDQLGKLSLTLSLTGLILALLVGGIASALGYDAKMGAYLLFLGFQIAAIVCGFMARSSKTGKAGLTTSTTMSLISLLLIA